MRCTCCQRRGCLIVVGGIGLPLAQVNCGVGSPIEYLTVERKTKMLQKLSCREQLKRQLGFLERSCSHFDAGHTDEAIRIATIVRVLIHHTNASTSLLHHLGASTISLLSTYPILGDEVLFTLSSPVRISDIGIHAPLDTAIVRLFMPANEWWNQVLVRDGQKDYTREFVAVKATNKDGGAHVDADLGRDYERLSTDGWTWKQEENGQVLQNQIMPTHYILLRQTGYELLNSPELLALSN